MYPFAWFGIICSAPKSAPELIYNHSERGFALISRRTESVQRMYFQCVESQMILAVPEPQNVQFGPRPLVMSTAMSLRVSCTRQVRPWMRRRRVIRASVVLPRTR